MLFTMRAPAISTIAGTLAAICLTAGLSSQLAPEPVTDIKVDQVGYLPNADKLAMIVSEKDTLISYVVGTGAPPHTSTCATADLAAVMAVAARVYRPFDAAFSARAPRCAVSRDLDGEAPGCAIHEPRGHRDGRVRRLALRR
jgi:Cellulase N-terminal ig-like domain